jgi:hypothetical protein
MSRRDAPAGHFRRAWPAVLVLLGSLLAACDPCSGVQACRGEPRISYLGQLTAHRTILPTGGVEIQFMRVDGIHLRSDTFTVSTSAAGWFEINMPALLPGKMTANFLVRPPPPWEPFLVEDVQLQTTDVRGHTRLFRPWSLDPYLLYLGEVYLRSGGHAIGGAVITFRRTGGIEIYPPVYQVTANELGRFWVTSTPATTGVLSTSVEVYLPAHGRAIQIPEVRLSTTQDPEDVRILRLGVGAQIYYYGVLNWASTGQPATGVEVEFRRTGGLAIEPERFVARTNALGMFPLYATLRDPFDQGELVGDLTIRPPAPRAPITITGIRLQAREDDVERRIGTWTIGGP